MLNRGKTSLRPNRTLTLSQDPPNVMAQTFHHTIENDDKKPNLNDSLFANSRSNQGRNLTAFTTRTHSVSKNTQKERNLSFGWRNSISPSNED